MLVLSRRCGQRIRVGDSISVTVLSISGGQVKLGLSGPPDVPFHREELYQRLRTHDDQPNGRRPRSGHLTQPTCCD